MNENYFVPPNKRFRIRLRSSLIEKFETRVCVFVFQESGFHLMGIYIFCKRISRKLLQLKRIYVLRTTSIEIYRCFSMVRQ